MDTITNTFTVTDLRHRTNAVLKEAASHGFAYLFRRSRLQAAVVDPFYLKALQEAYEDYLDTLEFDKTVTLKRVSLETHKKSFQRRS